jgi:hypothetical protein
MGTVRKCLKVAVSGRSPFVRYLGKADISRAALAMNLGGGSKCLAAQAPINRMMAWTGRGDLERNAHIWITHPALIVCYRIVCCDALDGPKGLAAPEA